MKSIFSRLICVAVLTLGLLAFYEHSRFMQAKKERDRYKQSTEALLAEQERYQIDSCTMALTVSELQLSLEEFKRYRAEDAEQIRKMGIELRSLRAVAKHTLDVEVEFAGALRDSVVVRDTLTVPLKLLEIKQPYLEINGVIENDSILGKVYLPVHLRQAVWFDYKYRFLWWRWKVKGIRQTISSDNPYVDVRYSEYITIHK